MAKKIKPASLAMRKWRAANPIKDIYNHKKWNAKQKRVSFTISLEDFTKWCMRTKYHILRGNHKYGMTIGRKDHSKGYEKGNLKMETLSDGSKERNYRYQLGWKRIECEDF